MRKTVTKLTSFMLAVLLLFTVVMPTMPVLAGEPPAAEAGDGGIVSGGNEHIQLHVDGTNGRFAVLPAGEAFSPEQLKSFAAVTIGGTEYTYGGHYPEADTHFSGVQVQEGTLVAQWTIGSYAIQQHLQVVQDTANHSSWAANIWYDVLYVGAAAGDISLRLLLDTITGTEDAAPVVVHDEEITSGRHFGSAPSTFHVPETAKGPKAFGNLAAASEQELPPQSLDLLNYSQAPAVGNQLFALQADPAQSLAPDSAALFAFPQKDFPAFEEAPEDEAARRAIYALRYGFYGMEATEDGLVDLTPEDNTLTLEDILPEAAEYPIGEHLFNMKNLLQYPASAAPGATVTVTRIAQPDGVQYQDNANDLAVLFADREATGGSVEKVANQDGSCVYTFTMPTAEELDAHGGGILMQLHTSVQPGYYWLRQESKYPYGWSAGVEIHNSLPHDVGLPGTEFTLAVVAPGTGKVYVDLYNSIVTGGEDVRYRRLPATVQPTPDETMNILGDFVTYYSVKLHSAAPVETEEYNVFVAAAYDPVLFDVSLPAGLELIDYDHCRDGVDGAYWIPRRDVSGIAGWDEIQMSDYLMYRSLTLKSNIGVNDLNRFKIAVYDGSGRELPYIFGNANARGMYDPTGTMNNGATYTVQNTKAALGSLSSIPALNAISYLSLGLYLPATYPGNNTKITDVHVVIGENISDRKKITVRDSNGNLLDDAYYAITAMEAEPGEQVQLVLFDTAAHYIDGVSFSPAVNAPGGGSSETVKNQMYDFLMPNAALEIQVNLEAPAAPEAPRRDIICYTVVNQQGEEMYDFNIWNQIGTDIKTQFVGERVYLTEPTSQKDPTFAGLEAERFWVMDRGSAAMDYVPVYSAANDPQAPAGAAYYFVMPDSAVGVGLKARYIETRKRIIINETAESIALGNGEQINFRPDYSHTFSSVNGYYLENKANPGSEVHLVLPREVEARQLEDGQWTPSIRLMQNASVTVRDSNGTPLALRLVPSADMYYDAASYREYAFTMPDSDVTADISWRMGSANLLEVKLPKLPAGTAEPKVSTGITTSRTAQDTTLYDVSIVYEEGDHTFYIDTANLPAGVVGVKAKGKGVLNGQSNFVDYEVEVSQDAQLTLLLQQLAPYPVITSIVQTTPYHSLYPRLRLQGTGIGPTTDESKAFDYRYIYTYSNEQGGSSGTSASAAMAPPTTSTSYALGTTTTINGKTVWTSPLGVKDGYLDSDEVLDGVLDISHRPRNLVGVSIEAARVGTDRWQEIAYTPVVYVDKLETAPGSYNFLGIIMEEDAKSYSAHGASNKTFLNKMLEELGTGTSVLDISSGSGFVYDPETQTFTLQNAEEAASVNIGAVITARVPKGKAFTVTTSDGNVRVRMDASVTLATPKQDLLVPPKTKTSGKYFEINLKKNTRYATSYEDVFAAKKKNNLKPLQIAWKNEIVPELLQLTQAVSVQLSNITLFDQSIVVGGSLRLSLPVAGGEGSDIFTVDVEQVKYGYDQYYGFSMQGFKANGELAIPEDGLLGLIPLEAGALADIDTLGNKQYYHFEAKLILMDIGFEGDLTLIPGAWRRYPDWLIPDKFNANVHAPIPIIPGVLELNRVGGGFSGLADTISADYSDITQMIPPFKLSVNGALTLLEFLEGDMHANLGPSEFWFNVVAGATFMGMEDMATMQFGYKVKYEKNTKVVNNKRTTSRDPNNPGAYHFTLGGSSVIQFLPKTVFLSGYTDASLDLYLDLSYEHLIKDGKVTIGEVMRKNTAFEFYLSGNLRFQIPQFKFLGVTYGPYTLLSVAGTLTHQYVSASAVILFIRVGFHYNWSTNDWGFEFELASNGTSSPATSIPAYNEAGEQIGRVTFGDNLALLASSQSSAQMQVEEEGAYTAKAVPGSSASIRVQGSTHLISVPNDPKYASDYSVIVQVGLLPDQFSVLQLDDSSGHDVWKPYAISGIRMEEAMDGDTAQSDAINALIGADGTLIQLAPGEWKVVANNTFDSWVLDAKAPPALTALQYGSGRLSLQAGHLDASEPYYISYGVNHTPAGGIEKYTELNTVKVDAASIAADGTLSLDWPIDTAALSAELDSGSYTFYARLLADIPGITEAQAADAAIVIGDKEQLDFMCDRANVLDISSVHAPAAVSSVTVSAGPNASMVVNWPAVPGANAYEVALYEVNGTTRTPMMVNQASDTDETQTQLVYTVSDDGVAPAASGTSNTLERTIAGLPVGGTFTVEVTALNTVTEHFELPMVDANGKSYTDSLASTQSYRAAGTFAAGSATIAAPQYPRVVIEQAVEGTGGLQLTIGEYGGVIQAASADGTTPYDMTLYAHVSSAAGISKEAVAQKKGTATLSHAVAYASAAPMYTLEAVNPTTGDSTSVSFMVVRSSVPPALTVDLTDGAVISNGINFSITGVTQPLATVAAFRGKKAGNTSEMLTATADADGNFTLEGTLAANETSRAYTVSATGTGGVSYQALQVKYGVPAESPQTGDSNNLTVWFVVMGVVLAGCALLFVWRRRSSKT